MRKDRIRRILWLLVALALACALWSPAAFAEPAVEDVSVIGAADSAPQTAAIIETVARAETLAEEVQTATVSVSDGLLQAGGFLQSREKAGMAALQSSDNLYPEAKAAIVAGLTARQTEIFLTGFQVPIADVAAVYQNVVNDHPEFFFVDERFSYTMNNNGSYARSLLPTYKTNYTEDDSMVFEATVDAIVSGIEPDWSELQKLLYLHDYIVTHCEYDKTYSNYSAYNALIDHVAVCQGYALSFCYLARRAGLSVDVVTSNALKHAWNVVYLGGERFYIDCTWDDPSNEWYEGYCAHDNFMLGRDLFYNGIQPINAHSSTDWICGMENCYNEPASTRYENAWWLDKITAIAQIGNLCAYGDDSSEYDVYLRDWTTGEVQTVPVQAEALWPVWEDAMYCWDRLFYSFAVKDGAFWFTTPEAIWKLTVDGALTQEHTLDVDETPLGYLYGIVEDGGSLYYELGTAPNGVTFTRKQLAVAGHVHDLTQFPAQEPTCTQVGWAAYEVCSSCGYTTYAEIPALGHDYNYMVTLEPGCETAGVTTGTCSRCTDVCYIEIPAVGHQIEQRAEQAPTCEESGWSAGEYCTRCDYTTCVEIPALGHDYMESGRIEPTCELPGSVSYVCSHDSTHFYTEEIPALGHDYVESERIEPTCETPGSVSYVCTHDATHFYTEEIPALGHNYVGGVMTQPDCETPGVMFYVCANDSTHTYTEPIPALGHNYVGGVMTQPGCETPGVMFYVCTNDSNHTYSEDIPALGHAWSGEKQVVKEPTETETGLKAYVCANCNATMDEEIIPSLGGGTQPLDPPVLTVTGGKARAGQTVSVQLDLANNPGIAGMNLTLAYDPALSLQSLTLGDALSSMTFTPPGDLTANPVNLFWDGIDADATSGTILTLTFLIADGTPDGSYPITITYDPEEVYDGNVENVALTVADGAVTVRNVLVGDVSGDGTVNAKDVTFLRRHIAGGYGLTINMAASDISGDGNVNAKDVTFLRRYIAGGYGIVLG